MALFQKKQSKASPDEAAADMVMDERYLAELRKIGREQYKELIAEHSAHIEEEVDAMMKRATTDLKNHTARRIDVMIGQLSSEITSQVNERMREYNRVSGDSQELVAQSLSRNAQMVHEKYQQLSTDLQRAVANQEVMMATVFQDSKNQVASIQSEQEKLLGQLRENEENMRRETEQLAEEMRRTMSEQSNKLNAVYEENLASVQSARDSQATMLDTLKRTTDDLQNQYRQLQQLLDKTIADQKEMVTQVINDNMSRIVEHYLIGALGEQSNIREQIPSILRQMEENKQAMVDDMKL